MMASAHPLRPLANALLKAACAQLPIGTHLEGYETRNPDRLVFSVEQLSTQREMSYRAAVHVAESAVVAQGVKVPVRQALQFLTQMAQRRAMPLVHTEEPPPLLALITVEGIQHVDFPGRLRSDD